MLKPSKVTDSADVSKANSSEILDSTVTVDTSEILDAAESSQISDASEPSKANVSQILNTSNAVNIS